MRALLILTLAFATTLAAQSYSVSSGSVSYTDLSSPTPSNLTAAQKLTAAISPGGFSFTYFGATYTSFKLGSGGYMIMGSAGTTTSVVPDHATAPGLVIAPDWTRLAPGSSLFSPTSPSMPPPGRCNYVWTGSVLSVEWNNVPLATSSSTGVRMKVVIDTATGIIEFHYGSLPSGCTGAMASTVHTAAISGPSGGAQEIIDATDSGFISANGVITAWPVNRYVRFTPGGAGVNNAPSLAVTQGGNTISNGGTVNVNYGVSLSALGFEFAVGDMDGDSVSTTASVTNVGATGMVLSEWQSGSAGVPYTLYPTSGVFNTAAGATHTVTLTASDGTDVANFTFDIVQAAASAAPTMVVSDGASVSHGQGATGTNRDFGSLDISAGGSAPLTITISNGGSGALIINGFNLTGDSAHFVLDANATAGSVGAAGSTSFTVQFDPTSVGQQIVQVSFTHNDPALPSPFSFEVRGEGTSTAPGPGPGSGRTPGGGGGGGGCVANHCDYWLIVLLLVGVAGLGARTRRQRAR